MKTVLGIATAVVILVAGVGLAAGGKVREFLGYVRASAETTVDGIADGLPREVRDKKLENDLALVRSELVERRVKLNQSARQIEQLRGDLAEQVARADRDRRLLAEAHPILERAIDTRKSSVRFASAELPLADFQREIDDLLGRKDRDAKEIGIKRETLARLETRQAAAEQALAESTRALETAEREVALLVSRRDHAEIEARTLALVNAISTSLKAPRESIGESLGRLRDEVSELEARNEAERDLAPPSQRKGETISREFDRLEALAAVKKEVDDARSTSIWSPNRGERRPVESLRGRFRERWMRAQGSAC